MTLGKPFSSSILLLILLFSILNFSVCAQTPDSWTQKTDVGGNAISGPCARSDAFSFTLNGKGYIGCGHDGYIALSDVWEYDPVSDAWTQKADYPGEPTKAVSFAIGNKGYVGTGGMSIGSKEFYAFDPVLNSWTKKADFGDFRYAAYGFSIGGKGYVGGGADNIGNWHSDLWEYDTSSNKWTARASLPHALALAGAFSISGKGYIVCGDSMGKAIAEVWCYDPVANSYAAKAPFPGPARRPGAGVSIGSTGFIYSGSGNSDLWQYYPGTDTWVQRANLPGNVYRIKAAPFAIGTKGYFVGGKGSNTVTSDCFVFDTTSKAWSTATSLSSFRRTGAVGFSAGGNGYMGTGVVGTSVYQNDFWMYDTLSDAWTQKANFAGVPRAHAVGFVIGNKGYIGTGTNGYKLYLDDFWEYDPASNKWSRKADYPAGRRQCAVGFGLSEKGYLGTGADGLGTNDWYEFDPKTNNWTVKAKFPAGPAERMAGFTIEKKGYIIAGVVNGNSSQACWEFNPDSNSWKKKADLLAYTYDATGFSVGGRGYLVGGVDGSITSYSRCLEFDPDSNVWRSRGNFVGGTRTEAFAFTIGNTAYLGTGLSRPGNWTSQQQNDFWQYTPAGIITAVNGIALCYNDTMPVLVPYFSAEQFGTGNKFSAQLSDSNGNFANPVLLNALPGSSPGLLLVGLPLSHSAYLGHNYKLRIVSNSPAIVGSSAGLIVFQSPKPVILWNSGTLSSAAGFKFYQWLLNDTAISGANLATWTPAVNGVYKLIATDNNGCKGISDSIVVQGLTVPTNGLLENVLCYPNPVVDEVHISGRGFYDATLLRPDGSICAQIRHCRSLNIRNVAAGIYILKISDTATGRVAYLRVVKTE